MRPLAAAAFFLFSTFQVFAQQQSGLLLFVVGDSAREITAGALAGFELSLVSSGPAAAENVRLTLDVPAGVTIDSIPELYGCDLDARPVRCFAGSIAAGESRTYHIIARAPQTAGTFVLRATFESDNAAPASAQMTIVTSLRASLYASMQRPRRGHAGMQLSFATYVGSYIHELPARNVRIAYSVTNGVITSIEKHPSWSCTIDGSHAECTIPFRDPSCDECNNLLVQVAPDSEPAAGRVITLTMQVSSDYEDMFPADNHSSSRIELYLPIAVTTTADAGEGSLRNAIEIANQSCDAVPCTIVFNIPPPVPAEGWFTIIPSTPLPPVTARHVVIDGTSQMRFTGDTNRRGPEIAIDGRFAGRGLEMHAACEGVVEGLAIGNFMENQGLWYDTPAGADCGSFAEDLDRRVVASNFIGTDPTGDVAWPNLRGLRADFSDRVIIRENVISRNRFSGVWMWAGRASFERNRITHNGASGIFLGPAATADVFGNTIANHPQMGVAIARGPQAIYVSGNSMRDNGGLGIDWGLDGVSPVNEDDRSGPTNAPVLLDARYDEPTQMTIVTMTWRTMRFEVFGGTNYFVDVYANRSADGDGEQPVRIAATVDPLHLGGEAFEVAVPGDHRGKWLTANGTRMHFIGFLRGPQTQGVFNTNTLKSSEMSNAVGVR